MENKRPPTGEPKADETPAAAPAEIKFRLSSGFRNRLKYPELVILYTPLHFWHPKHFDLFCIFSRLWKKYGEK